MVGRTGETSLAHDALRECGLFAGLDVPILGMVAAGRSFPRIEIDAPERRRLSRHLLRSLPGSGDGERLAPPLGGAEQRLPWPYTQGELAGMIGGSRQSMNRLLPDFVAPLDRPR